MTTTLFGQENVFVLCSTPLLPKRCGGFRSFSFEGKLAVGGCRVVAPPFLCIPLCQVWSRVLAGHLQLSSHVSDKSPFTPPRHLFPLPAPPPLLPGRSSVGRFFFCYRFSVACFLAFIFFLPRPLPGHCLPVSLPCSVPMLLAFGLPSLAHRSSAPSSFFCVYRIVWPRTVTIHRFCGTPPSPFPDPSHLAASVFFFPVLPLVATDCPPFFLFLRRASLS